MFDEEEKSPELYVVRPDSLILSSILLLTLDKIYVQETLRSPASPHGSKIDTFLPGHPLVVTTLHNSTEASINGVEITQWNIYNDGNVLVHGVADFFYPAYQTIVYPWFDDSACNNK
ncbi:hypothetical protein FRX31_010726 [Thalictrum thalictroides]|uniref:Uncharacterized protein n=1 Tax=Thalictrum thalictroides TaxID=46969 RepID=A0A7J6WQP9_THATH|nr:hypothetical protein FRX31_010726 [Thalictrum thalictroides]